MSVMWCVCGMVYTQKRADTSEKTQTHNELASASKFKTIRTQVVCYRYTQHTHAHAHAHTNRHGVCGDGDGGWALLLRHRKHADDVNSLVSYMFLSAATSSSSNTSQPAYRCGIISHKICIVVCSTICTRHEVAIAYMCY